MGELTNQNTSNDIMSGCVPYLIHCIYTPSLNPIYVSNILNLLGNAGSITFNGFQHRRPPLLHPLVGSAFCGV